MRTAKTMEERQALRAEHHQAMQARAKVRGVILDQPRTGARMGLGSGMGPRRDGGGPTLRQEK